MHAAVTSSAPATDSCREKCLRRDPSHPPDLEDLIEDEEPEKNWKGIIISLLVIILVLGLVITAIIVVTPDSENEKETGRLSLDDFLQGKYTARRIVPVWATKDADMFTYIDIHGNIVEVNCTTNTSAIFLDNSTMRGMDTAEYKLSTDRQFVLFPHHVKQLSEHRRLSRYRLLDRKTREQIDIAGPRGLEFQYAAWSPVGHALVVVQKNDIFYNQDIRDVDEDFLPVTSTGDSDRICNGVPDWLYAEEILMSDNAVWMSPDGVFVLYATFNATRVDQYHYMYYGDADQQYPGIESQRYPKAGTPNPTVELHILNINTNTSRTITPPEEFKHRDYYVMGVSWRDGATVLITWLNRPQNVSITTVCRVWRYISCHENYNTEAPDSWIEPTGVLWSSENGAYFTVIPQTDDSGSYDHIAKINSTSKLQPRQFESQVTWLRAGRLAAMHLLGYDESNRTLYFLGEHATDGPRQRHVYSVSTIKDDGHTPECVTCILAPTCTYISAVCGTSCLYCTLTCEGPGVPYTAVYFMSTFQHVITLENNEDLDKRSLQQSLPTVEYHKIPTEDNQHIWLKLLLPPLLDKEEILRYNVVISLAPDKELVIEYCHSIISGAIGYFKILIGQTEPGSGRVTSEFAIGWEHVLSSTNDVIVVTMETRDSGGGRNSRKQLIYKRLGGVEVEGILAAVGFLKTMKYVGDRICIYGTEYGGYLSAAALGHNSGGLDCAISLSPITDFRYMDSFYAERYMGSPTEEVNLYNYKKAVLSANADKLKNKKMLVLHGTSNDRVHFQHSAQFLKALSAAGVGYTSQVYADKGDILRDGEVRAHVYTTMSTFLSECLGQQGAHDAPAQTDEYDYYDE